jgi:hypothetical protein
MRSAIFGLCALVTATSGAAQTGRNSEQPIAPAVDKRAFELIDLFLTACISTNAEREAIVKKLHGLKPLAEMLPSEGTEQLHKGTGGIAWTVKSSIGTRFLVDHNAKGHCSVRNIGIDVKSIRVLVRKFAEDIAKSKNLTFRVGDEGPMGPRGPNAFYQEYLLDDKNSGRTEFLFSIRTDQGERQSTYATFARMKK